MLELNTLGDPESRAAYREALVAYFSARRSELSEDSQRRLDANPLRILDSKDAGDIRINADAPAFDRIPQRRLARFLRRGARRARPARHRATGSIRAWCAASTTTRHTVFEFVTTDLGAQGTVLAGGRYDGLVELMGGPAMAGVGWAAGIERLALLIDEPPAPARPVALVPIGEAARERWR